MTVNSTQCPAFGRRCLATEVAAALTAGATVTHRDAPKHRPRSPFDDDYHPLLRAAVFTIHACGFTARIALENSGWENFASIDWCR